jgi:hypothetical protein
VGHSDGDLPAESRLVLGQRERSFCPVGRGPARLARRTHSSLRSDSRPALIGVTRVVTRRGAVPSSVIGTPIERITSSRPSPFHQPEGPYGRIDHPRRLAWTTLD